MGIENIEEGVEKTNLEAQALSILHMSAEKLEEEIMKRNLEVEEDNTLQEKRELLARDLMGDKNFEKFFKPLRSKEIQKLSEEGTREFFEIEKQVDDILAEYEISKDTVDFIKNYIERQYFVAITSNPKSYRATMSELAPLIADKYKGKDMDIETEKVNIIKIIEGVAEKNNLKSIPEAI